MPDGRTFIAGIGELNKSKKHTGGALQIWDAAEGRLLQTVKQSESVSAVAVARSGKTWASGDSHGTVRLWDVQKRRVIKTLRLHRDVIFSLKFSPDGHFLASAGGDDLIRLTVLP